MLNIVDFTFEFEFCFDETVELFFFKVVMGFPCELVSLNLEFFEEFNWSEADEDCFSSSERIHRELGSDLLNWLFPKDCGFECRSITY